MRWPTLVASVVVVAACGAGLRGQDFAPPPPVKPADEQLRAIAARGDKLGRALGVLRRQGVKDPALADIEVYSKAADWIARHNEFFQKEYADWTLEALDRGLLRASQQAMGETPWLAQTGQAVIRAYRSGVDSSVQPYAVTFPPGYGRDANKRWRLDVVLHGRDPRLNEVAFLHQHNGDRPAPKDRHYIQLDIFGRGNNAYRWAGEADVDEALNNFLGVEKLLGRDRLIDPRAFVLRGFSMGGAGTWHLGLHQPDRWAVLGPGAGFTSTRGHAKDLPEKLPDYQEACLRIYDAVDYAENVFNVPVVAYSGAKDPQIRAARNIEDRLKKSLLQPAEYTFKHLVAPDVEHRFPPEWQAKAEAEYGKHATKGRTEYPNRVRFVTYTLRYPSCAWVTLMALEAHYKKSLVDAELVESGFRVKTENVRALHLVLPPGTGRQLLTLDVDGQKVEARPVLNQAGNAELYLERRSGRWQPVIPQKLQTARVRTLQKVSGLQGPIDDAFTSGFLCVRGTGKPWHQGTQDFADRALKRFQDEWDRYFRGRLVVKDDEEVTAEDFATKHLILFGDPGSNGLIAQALDGLPLRWTRESITLAGRKADAAGHVPVLVYPSPLNASRYMVLNTGHTFHAADFRGANALLYPRLGDYALLKPAPTEKDPHAAEVVSAGLFDDFWRAPEK